jgi:hypothetical protein
VHASLASEWRGSGRVIRSRALWHAARAAIGPDDALSVRLFDFAEELVAGAALVTAADYFELAGRLATRTVDCVTAFQRSGESFLRAGSLERASRLLVEALSLVDDIGLRTPIIALLGETEAWRTGPLAACQLLLSHARRLEALAANDRKTSAPGTGPSDHVFVLCVAAMSMLIAGDVGQIADIGHKAMSVGDEGVDEVMRTLRDVVLGFGLSQCGDADGARLVARSRERADSLVQLAPKDFDVLAYFLAVADTTSDNTSRRNLVADWTLARGNSPP